MCRMRPCSPLTRSFTWPVRSIAPVARHPLSAAVSSSPASVPPHAEQFALLQSDRPRVVSSPTDTVSQPPPPPLHTTEPRRRGITQTDPHGRIAPTDELALSFSRALCLLVVSCLGFPSSVPFVWRPQYTGAVTWSRDAFRGWDTARLPSQPSAALPPSRILSLSHSAPLLHARRAIKGNNRSRRRDFAFD